jgi:RNA polymerase sigma-70 factor (ECF subfamily)
VAAFTRADPDALVALLRADVELETPPVPTWFTGRGAVVGFLGRRVLRSPDLWRMVPTSANGQHALVAYQQAGDGRYTAYGVQVLTLIGARIARITSDLCFPRESPSSRDGISYWRIVA